MITNKLDSNCSAEKNGTANSSVTRSFRRTALRRLLPASALAVALIILLILSAGTQTATSESQPNRPCPDALVNDPDLFDVPVLPLGAERKQPATIILGSQEVWMSDGTQCAPQYVRTFRELAPKEQKASVDKGQWAGKEFPLPRPGPTFRARVGDLIQLTFLNQIDVGQFPDSIDGAEKGLSGGCDETSAPYPGNFDKFPNCFHGSSTGNIHFHGTHTNPNTTGDNVFLEIRPSLRVGGQPIVTPETVRDSFDKFFEACEQNLSATGIPQWPTSWRDLPREWTKEQETLLRWYDRDLKRNYPPPNYKVKELWPSNEKLLAEGKWPQYYLGAYPYCFRLPEWPAKPKMGGMGTDMADMHAAEAPLIMGQAPGTHWYHAHKHGSTTINVANGLTGVFIIEGKYDDDLNAFYGKDWTRKAKVMVINQLGVTPKLMRGGGGPQPPLSVNGQIKPIVTMQPGEVQMWRIANTGARSGTSFVAPSSGVRWRQIAQDGVQYNDANYQNPRHHDHSFFLAAGNRADLLVKAPTVKGSYNIMVQSAVDPNNPDPPVALVTIKVGDDPAVNPESPQARFIDKAPSFPPFLKDIGKNEVSDKRDPIVFASKSPQSPMQHTIDGEQFSNKISQSILLNKFEEWKIVNETYLKIAHPFHIHINPFQVVEVFDPNEVIQGTKINIYIFDGERQTDRRQCRLFTDQPDRWGPCDTPENKNGIWWDVFSIPAGRKVTGKDGKTVNVPGYFKMRSRFVDYTGQYVIHCHILAHEDRGMMNIVEVRSDKPTYTHH